MSYLVLGYSLGLAKAEVTYQQSFERLTEANKQFDKLPKDLSRWIIDETTGEDIRVASPSRVLH